MSTGVKLLLVNEAKIPDWLKCQTKFVEISRSKIKGVIVRNLFIHGGEARFVNGGFVEARTRAMAEDEFYVAFLPDKVLEILDQDKGLKRNHFECTACIEISGEIIGQEPGDIQGQNHYTIRCEECKKEWEIKNW